MGDLTRREFLGQVAGAALAASLSGSVLAQTAAAPAPRKRNVLFFMSDDMRQELGSMSGLHKAQTPNLDALVKSGVGFERNYCQFPLCNPSRASLLTGRYPVETGVLGNGTRINEARPDWTSLPKLFKDNGYVTARTGKIFHTAQFEYANAWTEIGQGSGGGGGAGGHNLEVKRGEGVPPEPADMLPPLQGDIRQAPGSDRLIILDGDGEANPDYSTATRTIEYLNKFKDQPFFLACGFTKPHSPPAAPQKFWDMYSADKIELTPDFAPWPTVPEGFPKAAIRMINADLFIGRGASKEEAKETIRAYIASCSFVDHNIGRVMAELDRLGLREKTIVVFVTDHGYQLGEKGKWSKAGSLFEMGTRVPLIIAAPGAKGNGKVCKRIVQSLDIYKTLAELAGLKLPDGIDGKSLVPLLDNPEATWDEPAYSVWSEDGATLHGVMVRTEKWRYAEFASEESASKGDRIAYHYDPPEKSAMLLDPVNDFYETKNLADDPKYADVRAELSKLVRQYAARLPKA